MKTGTGKVIQKKLRREVYNALKSVVGEEWIYEQRSVVQTYSKLSIEGFSFIKKHEKDPHLLPACVVLPASTEEIQTIVRICNRYECSVYSLHQRAGVLQSHHAGSHADYSPLAHEQNHSYRC